MSRAPLLLLPLTGFLALAAVLLKGLFSEPRYQVSIAVDRPMPTLQLADLFNPKKIYDGSEFLGQKTLLNVWGVWCVTCAIELPYLTQLRERGVRIVGLYYSADNDPDLGLGSLPQVQMDVRQMLDDYGDPYQFNMYDRLRSYGLDLGVTGAPEMFLVDEQGIVRIHHVGELNPRVWRQKFAQYYPELDPVNADQ